MVVLHDALSAMDDWKFHEVIRKVSIPHADRGVVVREHLCADGRRKAIESNDAANFTDTSSNAVAANNNRAGVRTGAHVRSWLRRRTK